MGDKGSKKPKGCIAKSECPGTHENEFTLFLLLVWLIEIRELRLFGRHHSLVRVRLAVEFEKG